MLLLPNGYSITLIFYSLFGVALGVHGLNFILGNRKRHDVVSSYLFNLLCVAS